jgi:hypothetical protein
MEQVMKILKRSLWVLATAGLLGLSGCGTDSSEVSPINTGTGGGTGSSGASGQGGSLARFAVADDYLYAIDGSELRQFNLSNPANPQSHNQLPITITPETLFPMGDSLLLVGGTQGMAAYSLGNDGRIRLEGTYVHVTSCDPVVANGTHAFVTLRSTNQGVCAGFVNELQALDIRNLSQIRQIDALAMDFPLGLGLKQDEDLVLVCADNGLQSVDVSDHSNLNVVQTYPEIEGRDLIVLPNDLVLVLTPSGLEQYRFRNGNMNFLSAL